MEAHQVIAESFYSNPTRTKGRIYKQKWIKARGYVRERRVFDEFDDMKSVIMCVQWTVFHFLKVVPYVKL